MHTRTQRNFFFFLKQQDAEMALVSQIWKPLTGILYRFAVWSVEADQKCRVDVFKCAFLFLPGNGVEDNGKKQPLTELKSGKNPLRRRMFSPLQFSQATVWKSTHFSIDHFHLHEVHLIWSIVFWESLNQICAWKGLSNKNIFQIQWKCDLQFQTDKETWNWIWSSYKHWFLAFQAQSDLTLWLTKINQIKPLGKE